MTKEYRYFLTVISAVLIFAVARCAKERQPVDLEEGTSFTQTLVVENRSQGTVTIIPVQGARAEPVILEPGNSTEMQFTVITMAELDETGNPIPATETVLIRESNSYVGMQSTDGILKVLTPGGETWGYLISLGECWFDNNFPADEHEIIVTDEEPAFGIPALRLCE
jgi:hypothetical protein